MTTRDREEELRLSERLADRWPANDLKTRKQAGTDLLYITGEQAVTRMNEVFGFDWSFAVIDKGENDVESWVLGQITVSLPGGVYAIRQQFGNCDIKRGSMSASDRFKSACTDSIKKSASLFGVGLFLYDDDERREIQAERRLQRGPEPSRPGGQGWPQARPVTPLRASGEQEDGTVVDRMTESEDEPVVISCEKCGETLTEVKFKSGDTWKPEDLAVFGRRKFKRILCLRDYREESAALKFSEEQR